MRYAREFITNMVIGGLLVVVPVYLTLLVLFKVAQTVHGLIAPFSRFLPAWGPAAVDVLALTLLLLACAAIGLAVRTRPGRALRERMEKSLFDRLPGYALFRGLTERLAGRSHDAMWKPALAEIEDALVPAFIVEELDDGRYTVFVPSAPTPMTGSVYVLSRARVHPLDVPFAQAIRCVSRWGSGSGALVAGMSGEARDQGLQEASPTRNAEAGADAGRVALP